MLIRPATAAEIPALTDLIGASVRQLGVGFYNQRQIELSLVHVFGVDSQLVADGTYYVAATGETRQACGGWSGRKTMYGGDQWKAGADPLLDPANDAARIRAFFVHPDHARRGIGRRLLEHCEAAASARGFHRFELVATLPGVPLYAACGYAPREEIAVPLAAGVTLPTLRMVKDLRRDSL